MRVWLCTGQGQMKFRWHLGKFQISKVFCAWHWWTWNLSSLISRQRKDNNLQITVPGSFKGIILNSATEGKGYHIKANIYWSIFFCFKAPGMKPDLASKFRVVVWPIPTLWWKVPQILFLSQQTRQLHPPSVDMLCLQGIVTLHLSFLW